VEDRIQLQLEDRTETNMEDRIEVKMEDRIEVKMEDRIEIKMQDRTGMGEMKKAEARVVPARQDDNLLGSVPERSSRPVLMCAQDFLPGFLVPVWQAVPRGVQARNKFFLTKLK